jgi:hypothetical protein
LWQQVDRPARERFGWQQPWYQPLPRSLGEGNPIFSAVSPVLRRGIRLIQHAPTEPGLEIQAWPDYFGGSPSDADRIEELVISCALSDQASEVASTLMELWVKGEPLDFDEGHVSTLVGRDNEFTASDRVSPREADHGRGSTEDL